MILEGDCIEKLKELEDNSVDSVVTDPPYGLEFMGKKWDKFKTSTDNIETNKSNPYYRSNIRHRNKQGISLPAFQQFTQDWAKEALRVLKPGGYLLSFGGTRTYHRMTVAIEDAGFEIRDMINWVYGSGFPKSLNIGKAADKCGGKNLSWFIDYILEVADEKGISRKELTMLFPSKNGKPTGWLWNKQKTQGITLEQYHKIKEFLRLPFEDINECERKIIGTHETDMGGLGGERLGVSGGNITKGTSPWEGWGTALKPAHEPICLARKPLSEKSVAQNVLKWGTGGINIDESRIVNHELDPTYTCEEKDLLKSQGRFPANLLHDGSDEVVSEFPNSRAGKNIEQKGTGGIWDKSSGLPCGEQYGDSGSASRFFKSFIYTAKASKSERDRGCEGMEEKTMGRNQSSLDGGKMLTGSGNERSNASRNNHPTVKPLALMKYLIQMITPPQGTVLDPFAGSGSTLVAAKELGFRFIGIEKEAEYVEIIKARLKAVQAKLI